MRQVNLDEEFEKFKERFCEEHNLEDAWQRYQREEGLVDITNNEFTTLHNTNRARDC